MLLKPAGPGLWTMSQMIVSQSILRFVSRMSVVQVSSSDLLVHSSAEPTPELCAELDALGTVKYIVVPNNLHRWHARAMKTRYPNATLLCSSLLSKNLHPDMELETPDPLPWDSDTLAMTPIHGLPVLNEFVFLHRPSKTLLVTDLCFNWHVDDMNLGNRMLIHLTNGFRPLTVTPFFRDAVTDRVALQRSLDSVMDWDFTTVHPCHTRSVSEDAKHVFLENTVKSYLSHSN